MWRRIKQNVRNICQKFVNISIKKRTEEFDDIDDNDLQSCAQIEFKNSANDMVLQVDGNWVSRSVIDAILTDDCEQKLLKICDQKELLRLETIITKNIYRELEVMASGCYSEVLRVKDINGQYVVFKICLINRRNKDGVVVQDVSQIASDVINSQRLSDLKAIGIQSALNYCDNFADITNNYYVWSHRLVFNKSDAKLFGDSNAKYKYFISQQTYGGKHLDSVYGLSPTKGLSITLQLISAMAVAEEMMQFEHRDLHLSNILIRQTQQEYGEYVLNQQKFVVKLNGIQLVIIDTTFSRSQLKIAINSEEEIVKYVYNDLSCLNLNDYKNCDLKKVYLKQNQITANKWQQFWPKTNIIWLSFCIEKISRKVNKWSETHHYNSQSTYAHNWSQLKHIKDNISATDSAKSMAQFCQLINK